MATLEMEGSRSTPVQATAASGGQQIFEGSFAKKKFQTDYSKKPYTETEELHLAKKTVKDLTRRIEESNSRARARVKHLQKLKIAKMEEEERNQFEKVTKEVEAMKQDIIKLKLDMVSILEEKRMAERQRDLSISKGLSHSSSFEELTTEIEEINEEQVLVEVARIEAIKETREIESQRGEDAAKFSTKVGELQNKKLSMVREIEEAKELETKLAITLSDISILESKLKLVESDTHEHGKLSSASLLEYVTKELEATKKELASVEAESFEFMSSMDVLRNELRRVTEEKSAFKKEEEKAEMAIQTLNSKILKAISKLEASCSAADEAKSSVSNLSLKLEEINSEAEAAEKEQSLISEETALVRTEARQTKAEIASTEERLEAALQDLKAVKSSEGMVLEKLKAIIQNTVRNRASSSKSSTKITISKFEYDYLKGNAAGAIEIADKKVAAAQAWTEALKANEKEIAIKIDQSRRESRELRAEKEANVTGTERSTAARRAKVGKSASSTVRSRSRSVSFSIRRRK